MGNDEVTAEVTVVNRQGMHARPVMQFVDMANRFESRITVCRGEQQVDGKSPMEIMLLEAICGTKLKITAQGSDASEAIACLSALVSKQFLADEGH